PPTPSATTKKPALSSTKCASSLISRLRPTSLTPTDTVWSEIPLRKHLDLNGRGAGPQPCYAARRGARARQPGARPAHTCRGGAGGGGAPVRAIAAPHAAANRSAPSRRGGRRLDRGARRGCAVATRRVAAGRGRGAGAREADDLRRLG